MNIFNSLPTLEAINAKLGWAVIVVAFFFGLCKFALERRIEALKSLQAAYAEQQAAATREAAREATARATSADERAALATARAESLEQSHRAMADALADANRVIAETQDATAAARRVADRAQGDAAPRTLTPEQRAALVGRLRGYRGILRVAALMGDPDAIQYATQLASVLREAGWDVPASVDQVVFSDIPPHLAVRAREGQIPTFARRLHADLAAVGLGNRVFLVNLQERVGEASIVVGGRHGT